MISNVRTTQRALIEQLQPQPDWRILILAGANDDLALVLSPLVKHITLICRAPEHVRHAEEAAAKAQQNNIVFAVHDPNHLPYEDRSFDLILCDHAAHKLPDTKKWLLEASRIIRPQGLLLIRTLSVPGTRLRGKKAHQLRESAEYINALCQLHCPTHRRYYSQNQWEDLLMDAGFDIQGAETSACWFDFTAWVDGSSLADKDRLRLRAMLIQAPKKAHEFLTPKISGDRIKFRLPEITILANSKANTI